MLAHLELGTLSWVFAPGLLPGWLENTFIAHLQDTTQTRLS